MDTTNFKSEIEIRKMLYADLIKYAEKINVHYVYQKKDELVLEILMKQSGRSVCVDLDLRDTVLESDRSSYPNLMKSADQTAKVSDHVMPEPNAIINAIRGNTMLLMRVRDFVKSGGGYLRIVRIFGGNCELVPMGVPEEYEDKLILPLNVLIKVNATGAMISPNEDVVIEDNAKPVEGIGRKALNMEADKAIDLFNVKNGRKLEFIEKYSYMKGSRELWKVKFKYKGKISEIANRKFLEAIGNGSIISLINFDWGKTKNTKNEYIGKVDVQIEDRHYTIVNGDHSKSEKIRKLYKSGIPMSQISKLLDINYSFTYCVVEKYRKLLS